MEIQKKTFIPIYKIQQHKDIYYRNIKIQITDIQKYKIQI